MRQDGYLNNNKLHFAVDFGNTLKWFLNSTSSSHFDHNLQHKFSLLSPQMKSDFLSNAIRVPASLSFHSLLVFFLFSVKLWFNFNLEIFDRHMRPWEKCVRRERTMENSDSLLFLSFFHLRQPNFILRGLLCLEVFPLLYAFNFFLRLFRFGMKYF